MKRPDWQLSRNGLFWVLLAFAAVIALHLDHLPACVTPLVMACIAWRILEYRRVVPFPSWPLKVLFVGATVAFTVFGLLIKNALHDWLKAGIVHGQPDLGQERQQVDMMPGLFVAFERCAGPVLKRVDDRTDADPEQDVFLGRPVDQKSDHLALPETGKGHSETDQRGLQRIRHGQPGR